MARERYGNWWYKQETDKHGEANGFYQVFYKDGNEPVFTNSNLRATLDYMIDQHIHELERANAALQRRDVIGAILESTTNLYARFGVAPSRENTVEKFTDEMTEFLDELIVDTVNPAELKDEFGDLLVTAVMAARQHLTEAQLIEAVWEVVTKNNRKSHETHEVSGGLITRKDKTKATA